MKRIIRKHKLGFYALLLFAFVAIGFAAYAEYNPRAVLRLNSSFSGDNAGVGLHTPTVATVSGSTASVSSSIYTSSTAAMDFDTASTITTAFDLLEFHVHTAAIDTTGTITLWYDSSAGSLFDTRIDAYTFTTTDHVFRPTRPVPFGAGDALRVEYPNSGSNVVATTIKYVTP